ncbi:hypothetical protein DC3_57310 [Deinococcus cellulosilyticus NBRC 106333 = KACC 11606]|uniref:Uncharacterized protein n=1 Tax=Deinococcus cellulosilyticus (strain DSM 18568 / NBRC 106333 / KACC 11606 / 5516J-15) TaxID=1223518 RepID=A0A511NC02_DEIC1|nr:hypothetical protein DC3_57310 [Deinococcus cellulosilyticus NBRC 106333 = KACC 11606]
MGFLLVQVDHPWQFTLTILDLQGLPQEVAGHRGRIAQNHKTHRKAGFNRAAVQDVN